jgi:hypothetical protein
MKSRTSEHWLSYVQLNETCLRDAKFLREIRISKNFPVVVRTTYNLYFPDVLASVS